MTDILTSCEKILDLTKRIEDNTVDMVFFDPPYFLSNGGFTVHAGERASVNKGDWDASMGADENFKFYLEILAEMKRILKPSGTIFVTGTYHCIYMLGYILKDVLNYKILNDISWYKPNGSPNLAGRQFAAKEETVIWASPHNGKKLLHTFNYKLIKSMNLFHYCKCGSKSKPKANFCGNCGKKLDASMLREVQDNSKWEIPTAKPIEKRSGKHPTQKPIQLLNKMILSATNEGDLVFDGFMGSGTTAVSAKLLGRKFIGCDMDQEFVDLTNRRLADEETLKELADSARDIF